MGGGLQPGDVRPQNNRILAAIASLDIYTYDGLTVHCLIFYLSCPSSIMLRYTHCVTSEPIVTRSVTLHYTLHHTHPNIIVTQRDRGHDMSWHRWQFHKITGCTLYSMYITVQLPVSGLTPGVQLYSLHRQVLVLAHQAQSVQASPGWHRSDIGVMWPLTSWVMSDVTLLQKQTISHRMLNRR